MSVRGGGVAGLGVVGVVWALVVVAVSGLVGAWVVTVAIVGPWLWRLAWVGSSDG